MGSSAPRSAEEKRQGGAELEGEPALFIVWTVTAGDGGPRAEASGGEQPPPRHHTTRLGEVDLEQVLLGRRCRWAPLAISLLLSRLFPINF